MINIETEGRRVYVTGDTYQIRESIRQCGGHWDSGRKAWWVGLTKKAEIEAAIQNHAGQSNQSAAPACGKQGREAPGVDAKIAGRAEYKGKSYYLAGRVVDHTDVAPVTTRDGAKVLLYARDGSFQFWATLSEVNVTKSYRGATTIRKVQDYAQAAMSGKAGTCAECGRTSMRLITCTDSSGLAGDCCPSCARLNQYERSFG
ncbi:MAG: hypothetical protein PHS60_15400 [Zavarzinia sp.]|nr:hypothetical protein [Zavarzinia sp.]